MGLKMDTLDSGEGRLRKTRVISSLRWLGLLVGLLLVVGGVMALIRPPFDPAWFFRVRGAWEIGLGLLLFLPFGRWGSKGDRLWLKAFLALMVVSVIFVFLRVIGVLFEARVIEAAGGELGLPAWSGTLIFLVLAQIPIILFLRFPDELD